MMKRIIAGLFLIGSLVFGQMTIAVRLQVTTTSGATASGATTINVTDASKLTDPLPFFIMVNNEAMQVTAINSLALTVVPAQLGTAQTAHSLGAPVGIYDLRQVPSDALASLSNFITANKQPFDLRQAVYDTIRRLFTTAMTTTPGGSLATLNTTVNSDQTTLQNAVQSALP